MLYYFFEIFVFFYVFEFFVKWYVVIMIVDNVGGEMNVGFCIVKNLKFVAITLEAIVGWAKAVNLSIFFPLLYLQQIKFLLKQCMVHILLNPFMAVILLHVSQPMEHILQEWYSRYMMWVFLFFLLNFVFFFLKLCNEFFCQNKIIFLFLK